eukprot:13517337-Alexandrium_andersonii.AAC.1
MLVQPSHSLRRCHHVEEPVCAGALHARRADPQRPRQDAPRLGPLKGLDDEQLLEPDVVEVDVPVARRCSDPF